MSSVYVVCWTFLQTFQAYFCIQANIVDPDQTAPKWAVWSGSTLFAKMTLKITSRWQILLNQICPTFANSVGSQLLWICTVCHYVNLYQQPGSSNLIGWKWEVGVAPDKQHICLLTLFKQLKYTIKLICVCTKRKKYIVDKYKKCYQRTFCVHSSDISGNFQLFPYAKSIDNLRMGKSVKNQC